MAKIKDRHHTFDDLKVAFDDVLFTFIKFIIILLQMYVKGLN